MDRFPVSGSPLVGFAIVEQDVDAHLERFLGVTMCRNVDCGAASRLPSSQPPDLL